MNLYEFDFKLVYENGKIKEKKYQIPSTDVINAAVELGRIYKSEEYEVVILDYKKFMLNFDPPILEFWER